MNKAHSSAWLIDEGSYRYRATIGTIDKKSKITKKIRADIYLKTQRKLEYLKEHIKLVKKFSALYNKIFREIQFLERITKELTTYQDELIKIIAIEYGVNQEQNFGIELLYKQNRFQGSKDINYSSSDKEISLFYKIKLLQWGNRIITVQPKIQMTTSANGQSQFFYELLLLTGISRHSSIASIFAESSFGVGKELNNLYTRRSYYSFSTTEGVEFKNGLMFVSFIKYYIRKNYGNIYDKTVYNQLSIAKKINFSTSKNKNITTQIGYFWDKSLINQNYQISGLIFSLWINV